MLWENLNSYKDLIFYQKTGSVEQLSRKIRCYMENPRLIECMTEKFHMASRRMNRILAVATVKKKDSEGFYQLLFAPNKFEDNVK